MSESTSTNSPTPNSPTPEEIKARGEALDNLARAIADLQPHLKPLQRVVAVLEALQDDVSALNKEAVMKAAENLNSQGLARVLRDFKEANELADNTKKAIGKVYDHIRTISLPDRMDEEGLESPMNVQGVGRVTLTSDVRVSFKDKEVGYRWLEEHGHDDLINETVNASSLAGLIRRKMRDGEEVPEEIFKVSPITRASITGTS